VRRRPHVRRGPDRPGPYALLALLAVVLLGGCAGEDDAADLPLGRQISAMATFTPTVHLFAEPVVARVEVVVDREHLDPDRLRLQTRFVPYDVERAVRKREDRDRFSVLRYEYVLRCLRIACIPEILPSAAGEAETGRGERRTFDLPAAQVRYDEPEGETRTLARAGWPELVSVSRIKQSDVPAFGFVFKTSVAPLAEPGYRISPGLLGAGLIVGALALLVLPVALVAVALRRRRPPEVVDEEPEVSALERALRLVEWAQAREDGAERRQALEALAVELDTAENGGLADSARTLAWSPAAPAPAAAEELVSSVREWDRGSA
jgi:hypothetical protein